MCFGGGGGGTITKPDYNAYDKQFELQKAAIDSQMSNASMLMQQELTGALQSQQAVREEILADRTEAAENDARLSEEAFRLSTLIGTPPPEKTAQAPTIGARDRGLATTKGKNSLRIRKSATSMGQGAGLNIT